MLMEHYQPRPPLSEHVHLLWYYDGVIGTTRRERLLPDGATNVIIDLGARDSVITGAHSKYFVIEASVAVHLLGIWFKPGGAFRFLTMPANEIRNMNLPLDDVWGSFANDLRDQVVDAATTAQKFAIAERALFDRMMRGRDPHPAVGFALGHFGTNARVTPVIDSIGISPRRFEQVFNEQVGLTPKLYCRIRRFQRVLQLINGADDVDWADVALSCGYFDQSHFIHDFQSFSGINPTEYVARGPRYINHVPMD